MKYLLLAWTRLLVLALLASAALAGGAEPHLEKLDVPGITNFTKLSDSSGFAGAMVGFGGATTPASMAELKAAGFTTVVNMRLAAERGAEVEASREAAEAAGLTYVHLPYNPMDAPPDILESFIATIGDSGQPVYLHCASATRIGALWMAARVLEDGWDVDDATQEAVSIAGRPERAVELGNSLIESRQP